MERNNVSVIVVGVSVLSVSQGISDREAQPQGCTGQCLSQVWMKNGEGLFRKHIQCKKKSNMQLRWSTVVIGAPERKRKTRGKRKTQAARRKYCLFTLSSTLWLVVCTVWPCNIVYILYAEIAYWKPIAITAHAGWKWNWNWKMAIMLSWENPFEFVGCGAAAECSADRVVFARLYSMVYTLWGGQHILCYCYFLFFMLLVYLPYSLKSHNNNSTSRWFE